MAAPLGGRVRRPQSDHLVKIERPFSIFVEESYDIPGIWIAHIVGHELDNVTQGQGPEDAVFMAYDLLRFLTGRCDADHVDHDLTVEAVIPPTILDDGEVLHPEVPAWECARCRDKFPKSIVEDVP